ncbi:DUF4189 domain-containing protein [Leeia sp. TBRC 13508]|uniref:DUF4189 domain-containing protein n=1 Tax=Leeia speluncae TaxID=2884804 RepID=A0ABS8D3P1_9NEIS|nr:DUF4189 domain-containing protein [Leeia speluncae]MCB6182812.1 DUF4189 domain-containing protein [Leeia speluncae]
MTVIMLLWLAAPAVAGNANNLCYESGNYDPQQGVCFYPDGSYPPHPGGVFPPRKDVQQHTPRDYFGAIAADVVNGQNSYKVTNYQSAAAAKNAALKGCGLSSCKVIIAYKNGCAATATSATNHVVGGLGDSPEEAEQNALDKCEQTKSGGTCDIWSKASCSYYE